VHPDAQFVADERRHAGENIQVDVRSQTGLNPAYLGVRDPDAVRYAASAQPRGNPRDPKLCADPTEKIRGPAGTPLEGGLPGWHTDSLVRRAHLALIGSGTSGRSNQRLKGAAA
jgi:hypothetical protein